MAGPRPNTFLIGGPKCGTTSLAHYLSEHPDVFLGYPKEPSFWSVDLKRSEAVVRLRGLDDYLALYRRAGSAKIVLDASTSYLLSEVAVARILAFAPDARFIVILRNPAEVAHAYHMEKVFNHQEDVEDFETAWSLQQERRAGRRVPPTCVEPAELQYLAVASLGRQLERVTSLVRSEQLLVLFTEDMARDPRAVYLAALGFLGLPDDGRTDFPVVGGAHFNRFRRLSRLYQAPPAILKPLVRSAKRLLRAHLSAALKSRMTAAIAEHRPRAAIPRSFALDLRRAFAADVALTEQLTGRSLRHWIDET
ncbi:sulfotransferase family protein [Chthonobacter rhizosphaerae]|uniref:sulfotransferase family protein n=1 Tax=Chthonobacter rhizosphaerae TaxID=2735553 RepID=UPI0015EF0C5D|nr:sulfotransferase [Chthonobacter rhizosphaerae]